MGLGGCYSIIKYLLIIFNFLFWVLGLVTVALAIWMLVDPTFYVSMVQDANDYLISSYFLLIAGIILVIIGFLGCCGSFKESNCLLITFFSLLLVIVVAELSAGLWGYLNRDILVANVKTAMKHTVEEEYHVIDNRKVLFDTFQQKLHCCGVNGPSDWFKRSKVELRVSSEAEFFNIPASCCRENVGPEQCSDVTKKLKFGQQPDINFIYSEGCYEKVVQAVKQHFGIIFGVGVAILTVQVLGLIFALVLAFAINRSSRYKA